MSCRAWIHCNKCFVDYQKQENYCITKCAHVLCVRCARIIDWDRKCPVCLRTTKYIPLKDHVPSSVRELFQREEVSHFQYSRVIEFQNHNKNELIQHLRGKCWEIEERTKTLLDNYNRIKEELNHAQRPPRAASDIVTQRRLANPIDQSPLRSCRSIPVRASNPRPASDIFVEPKNKRPRRACRIYSDTNASDANAEVVSD